MNLDDTNNTVDEVITLEEDSPVKPKTKTKTPTTKKEFRMSIDLISKNNTFCMDGSESGGKAKEKEILDKLNK